LAAAWTGNPAGLVSKLDALRAQGCLSGAHVGHDRRHHADVKETARSVAFDHDQLGLTVNRAFEGSPSRMPAPSQVQFEFGFSQGLTSRRAFDF